MALEEVRAARISLHNVWQKYLASSVEKWKGFCLDFEKQDAELAAQTLQASEAVKTAQQGLNSSKKTATKIEEVDMDGRSDRDEPCEISDEEEMDNLDNKGNLIKEGMTDMLQTLENLQARAESMAEEKAPKRPRLQEPKDMAPGLAGTVPAMEPFGKPGQQT